jgi:AraC-like DNA-binding protein
MSCKPFKPISPLLALAEQDYALQLLQHRLIRTPKSLEGHSVQQAAWMSGYQHATNFATAFRRRYGICPGMVRS